MAIEINVKGINLVLNIKLSYEGEFDKHIEDTIDSEVYNFLEKQDEKENRKIIEDNYKTDVFDQVYEYGMEEQLVTDSKEVVIKSVAFNLMSNDIKDNFKEVIILKTLNGMTYTLRKGYVKSITKTLVKSLNNKHLSEEKRKEIVDKIERILETLLED